MEERAFLFLQCASLLKLRDGSLSFTRKHSITPSPRAMTAAKMLLLSFPLSNPVTCKS